MSELVVVVTGLSGAGKSTAVHALEDVGFFCVDNLPTPVLEATLQACDRGGIRRVALGIDVRVRSFLDDATQVLDAISRVGERKLMVLFLDASDQVLSRRFSSTRRPHPLTTIDGMHEGHLLDEIRVERQRLAQLRARATLVVDTSRLNVHDLRQRIVDHFATSNAERPQLRIRFLSFGFKYGAPVDADVVLDVRFLPNPFFVAELRDLPGTDARVRDYVLERSETRGYLEHVEGLLEYCLPRFAREGKAYLSVAIGCTGGRHRSVAIVGHLAQVLEQRVGMPIEVLHRDVARVEAAIEGVA